MPTYIALIRGINVGGRNMLPMAELKDHLGKIGLTDAKSLLHSGNLVFKSARRTDKSLEQLLEVETKKRFGILPDYIIRTAGEWAPIISRNPFPKQAKLDPGRLIVMFFKQPLNPNGVEQLRLAVKGPETLQADGRQLYIVYPDGMGTSKLTNAVIEKKLATRGTARNWNTVLKLAALIQE